MKNWLMVRNCLLDLLPEGVSGWRADGMMEWNGQRAENGKPTSKQANSIR